MEILGRNPNPDGYSIKSINLGFEPVTETRGELYFYISLEPKFYQGMDGRLLRKRNPCKLKVSLSEFQEMEETLRDELQDCYHFLAKQNLLRNLWDQKKAETKEAV